MRKLDRREFLGSIAGLGASIFVGGCAGKIESNGASFPSRGSSFAAKDLAVASGKDPAKNVRAAVDALGGMKKLVSSGDFVVIKPNIAWNRPADAAATTNPEVVAELVKMCKECAANRILVVDHIIDKPAEAVLNFTRIRPAAEKAGAEVTAAQNESDYRSMEIPKGKLIKSNTCIKDILKADVFINVPIAKAHSSTKLTLGMKNLMGCNWNRQAWHASSSLDQCIADYAGAVRADLVVLDANRILLTNGPKGPGETRDVEQVIAGVDQVAVDAYGATLFGTTPKDIGYIRLAHEAGLGEMDLGKMNLLKA
jgi:uncharacterized protein (DUF362 family)